MSPYRKSWERTGAGGTCSSGHHGAGSQCPRRGVCRYEPKLKCNGEVRWTGTPLTCQFCTKLQSGGRKMQQGRRSPAKWSQQPCWDTPYRKWSERRGGHSATGSREDSGLLSRECGGGRIHASPRMPCQGRCENVPAGRSKTVPLNAVEWASRFVGRWRSGSVR